MIYYGFIRHKREGRYSPQEMGHDFNHNKYPPAQFRKYFQIPRPTYLFHSVLTEKFCKLRNRSAPSNSREQCSSWGTYMYTHISYSLRDPKVHCCV